MNLGCLESLLEDQGGKTQEDHLYRLFVGWVPKLYTESDLLPIFQKYGTVEDIVILKDKSSGSPRGCAFVSYAANAAAEAAIKALDKIVHLPGALSPMEVRYARSHQYVQAGSGPEDNRQLFFSHAPLTATETHIKELFNQFGEVQEVNLFRDSQSHASKGSGFVTMATRAQAIAAMSGLDEKQVVDGGMMRLSVKWADPELQSKKRRAQKDSNAENRMLFFAKVSRSASEDDVQQLFQQFGQVQGINLFRAFQGAPITKGCGLVTMGNIQEAVAAIEALDNKYVWHGVDVPMVVKWMDAQLQKRRRDEHLAAMRQGLVPSMSMTPDMWLASRVAAAVGGASASSAGCSGSSGSAGLSHGRLLDAAAAAAATAQAMPEAAAAEPGTLAVSATSAAASAAACGQAEIAPAGCAADAYKLFVGNIPKNFTEQTLRPLLESAGRVVELLIVRDKLSHESKGSAFVWYATKAEADWAVVQFNLRHVLSEPGTAQDRPLVVRKANVRKPPGSSVPPLGALPLSSSGSGAATTRTAVASLAAVPAAALAVVGGPPAVAGSGLSMDGSSAHAPSNNSNISISTVAMMDAGRSMDGSNLPCGDMLLQLHQPLVAVPVQQQLHQQSQPQAQQQYPIAIYPEPPPMHYAMADAGAENNGMLQSFGSACCVLQQQQQQPLPQHQQQHQQQPSMTHLTLASAQQQQQLLPATQLQVPQQQQQQQYVFMQPQHNHHHQQQQYALPQPVMSPPQQQLLSIPPPAASSLAVEMALQLTTHQMSLLSGQMCNIASMSGCSVGVVPDGSDGYMFKIKGKENQVDTARGLVTLLLGQMLGEQAPV